MFMSRSGITLAVGVAAVALVLLPVGCVTTPQRAPSGALVTMPRVLPSDSVLVTLPTGPKQMSRTGNAALGSQSVMLSYGGAEDPYPTAKLTRLDDSKRVGMVSAGLVEGLRRGDTFYTVRDEQATGRLRVKKVFEHVAICSVRPLNMSRGKLGPAVGDMVAVELRGRYPAHRHDKMIVRQGLGGPGTGGVPDEEELRSLRERVRETRETGIMRGTVTTPPKADESKAIEAAWKRALAEIPLSNPLVGY